MSDDLIKALQKEAREDAEIITRLRADLAAVTAERDAAKKSAYEDAARFIEENVFNYSSGDQNYWSPRNGGNTHGLEYAREFRARAAIEGVTVPVALWQHKKTGGVYEIVGECQIEATNAPGVLYRNTSTGVTWMRPKEEFFDGRFVEWRKPEPSI